MHTIKEVSTNAQLAVAACDDEYERVGALLLGGAAINLAIIADAVVKLQADMTGKPKDAPLNLRDLTDEERRVVEALRAGDLTVEPIRAFDKRVDGFVITGGVHPTD